MLRWLALLTVATAVLATSVIVYEAPWSVKKSVTPIASFSAPFVFGRFSVPEENPLSEESFRLGRHLFYDPMLSGSNVVSCASCHIQRRAFTDGLPKSIGSHGMELEFSSMSLANLLWGQERFFWNGRATSLEQQALMPIVSIEEMDQDLNELLDELNASPLYVELFGKAYGEVSIEAVAKGLATFMRLLISDNSKYDQYLRGETTLTEDEELGRKLFMAHPDVKASMRGGNCIDCHSQFLTSGFRDGLDGFSNNGLDTDDNLPEGLMGVTNDPAHKGLFKVPTLRNIAVTGPYMHDGRFETLLDVMEHYNHGIKLSETLSPLILEADNEKSAPSQATGLQLSQAEVSAIIAFLQTLTDKKFLENPDFSNPFERLD